MSENTNTGMEKLMMALTAVSILAALLGSYVILPYRVQAVETAVAALAVERKSDHDILVRIEEDLLLIQKSLDRKGNNP